MFFSAYNAKFNAKKVDCSKFSKFDNTKQTIKLLDDDHDEVILNFKRRSSLTYLGALSVVFYVAYILTSHEHNATHVINGFTHFLNYFNYFAMNNALKNV